MAVSNGAWFCIIFLAICVIICLVYYIQTIYIKFRLRKAYKQQQAQMLASRPCQEHIVETTNNIGLEFASDAPIVFSIDHQITQRDHLLCGTLIQDVGWDYNDVPRMAESSVENNAEDSISNAEQFIHSHREWMQQQWARINEPYEEPSPTLLRRNTNPRPRNRGNIVEATNNLVQEPRSDIANLTNAYSNLRVGIPEDDTERWANDPEILRNIGFVNEITERSATETTPRVLHCEDRALPPRYSTCSRIPRNLRHTEEEQVVERPPDPRREDTGRVILDPDHAKRIREMHLQWMEAQWAYQQDNNPSAYDNQRQLRRDIYRRPATESQPRSRNRENIVEATNNLVQETRTLEEHTEINPEITRNLGFIYENTERSALETTPREQHYVNRVPPPRYSSIIDSNDVTPLVLEANHLLERLPASLLQTEEEEEEVIETPADPRRENVGTVVLDPDHARRIREMHLQWMETQWAYEQDNNPSMLENENQVSVAPLRTPATQLQPLIVRNRPIERPRRNVERTLPPTPRSSNRRRSNIGRVVLAPDHTNRIREMHLQWNDPVSNPTATDNLQLFTDDIHRRVITGSGRTQPQILNQEPPPSYDMPPSYEEAMKSIHM